MTTTSYRGHRETSEDTREFSDVPWSVLCRYDVLLSFHSPWVGGVRDGSTDGACRLGEGHLGPFHRVSPHRPPFLVVPLFRSSSYIRGNWTLSVLRSRVLTVPGILGRSGVGPKPDFTSVSQTETVGSVGRNDIHLSPDIHSMVPTSPVTPDPPSDHGVPS